MNRPLDNKQLSCALLLTKTVFWDHERIWFTRIGDSFAIAALCFLIPQFQPITSYTSPIHNLTSSQTKQLPSLGKYQYQGMSWING